MKLRILYCLLAAALLSGCLKDNTTATVYVLKPLVQEQSVDRPEPLADGVRLYSYPADTADWQVLSYDDALAGVITSKENPSEQQSEPASVGVPFQYTATAPEGEDPYQSVGWLQMPVTRQQQMVVAVDTQHKLFAYTLQEPVLNVPYLYVSLVFAPYKEGRIYKSGNWVFRNDFYNPPLKIKAFIDPKYRTTADARPEPYTNAQVKIYAYAADTTDWKIRSFEDAWASRITLKRDEHQQRDEPNFLAYPENGMFSMTVDSSPLMIVVADRTNKIFAYTKQTPDLSGESPTWSLTVNLWLEEWISREEGWTVVNERFSPENQKPDPEPEPEPEPEVPDPQPATRNRQ